MCIRVSLQFAEAVTTSIQPLRTHMQEISAVMAPQTRVTKSKHEMIQIREIDHLVLRIIDLDRMLWFYCDVLGCRVERRRDDIGLIQLRAGQSLIDLVTVNGKLGQAGGAPPGTQARNLDHFCLNIEPFDENTIRAHLKTHGIDSGPVASRYGAKGQGPSIYVSDPEGNVVELKGSPAP